MNRQASRAARPEQLDVADRQRPGCTGSVDRRPRASEHARAGTASTMPDHGDEQRELQPAPVVPADAAGRRPRSAARRGWPTTTRPPRAAGPGRRAPAATSRGRRPRRRPAPTSSDAGQGRPGERQHGDREGDERPDRRPGRAATRPRRAGAAGRAAAPARIGGATPRWRRPGAARARRPARRPRPRAATAGPPGSGPTMNSRRLRRTISQSAVTNTNRGQPVGGPGERPAPNDDGEQRALSGVRGQVGPHPLPAGSVRDGRPGGRRGSARRRTAHQRPTSCRRRFTTLAMIEIDERDHEVDRHEDRGPSAGAGLAVAR